VKLGAVFPQLEIGADPRVLARYACEVERIGFDSVVVYDHVLGADPQRPRAWGTWQGPYTYRDQFHEPFVLFGYFAAMTTRLELVTSVIIVPQRQAPLVAKQAAEVDVLTNGRLRLGVGSGWNRVEYDALGVDFETRGSRMEEQIALMRALWTTELVDFVGKWHRVEGAGLNPLPVQRPIPIWMGGGYDPVKKEVRPGPLRRIARIADGWLTHVEEGDDRAINAFRELVKRAGRDEATVGLEARLNAFRILPEDEWPRAIEWWRWVGATHLEVSTMGRRLRSLDEHLEALRQFVAMARG
jgi:probable F420-dependent oxidoreductase